MCARLRSICCYLFNPPRLVFDPCSTSSRLCTQALLSVPGKILTVLVFVAVFIGLAYNGFVNTSRGLDVSEILTADG